MYSFIRKFLSKRGLNETCKRASTLLAALALVAVPASALELVIGEERVEPGIVFIFEGAVKDHVLPEGLNLKMSQTHVHIEGRVNWDNNGTPDGTPMGGFVPFLRMNARVINQRTGLSTFVDMLPHLNLIDSFHYARNMSLPGKISDLYTVVFNVVPPSDNELFLHKDWVDRYGPSLMYDASFTYRNVDFMEIALAKR